MRVAQSTLSQVKEGLVMGNGLGRKGGGLGSKGDGGGSDREAAGRGETADDLNQL